MSKASRIAHQLLEADEPFVSDLKDTRRMSSTDPNKYITWATITWRADIEYRSWGIKAIDAYVDRVELTMQDEDGNELNPETLTAEAGWTFSVNYRQGESGFSMYPFALDVDWASKTAYIQF